MQTLMKYGFAKLPIHHNSIGVQFLIQDISIHLNGKRPKMLSNNLLKYDNLNIYVGYDSKEDIAYRVCKHSILKRSGANVKIRSLKLYELMANKLYNRTIDPLASTEFTYSRFLVPTLNNFKGWQYFVIVISCFLRMWKKF